jgi:hypothetical protein
MTVLRTYGTHMIAISAAIQVRLVSSGLIIVSLLFVA